MHLAALLLAALYSLPDGVKTDAPDAGTGARIARALAWIRTGGERTDRGVRELALVGEPALPAVVSRLNQALAGERLLLLAAVRRMPRAATLLRQAARDENPAIRAWVSGPPAREPVDLRDLAARYLDLLALSEEQRRIQVDLDLAGLDLGVHPRQTGEAIRERMRDRQLAEEIHYERHLLASRFARAGAQALRSGQLEPALDNPVFVTYLDLLRAREASPPLFYAVPALVAVGERLAPVLEPLLDRENHDPRVILRILFAVRADSGRGLFDRFDSLRPDAQRALVALAPQTLREEGLTGFLEKAAQASDESVRGAALDALLRLDAPAGQAVAAKLLDPGRYGANEFRRAARLLGRCDEIEPLVRYAELTIPDDESDRAAQLHHLQQVCASVLRQKTGAKVASIGERFLKAESVRLRRLGMDLIRDGSRLLELAQAEADPRFARMLGMRALEAGGPAVAKEVVALFRKQGGPLPTSLHQMLKRTGCVRILIELAREERERTRALGQLARLARIGAEHADDLLELHRAGPGDGTLDAILPLGGERVQQELAKAGAAKALEALAARAEMGERLTVSIPLLELVTGAGAQRLRQIRKCAAALLSVEPGLFHALFLAWDSIPAGDAAKTGAGIDGGPESEKATVLRWLARSDDKRSANLLLDMLLRGELKQPPFVLGTLEAATRLLPADRLVALVPLLRRQVRGEQARADKLPPLADPYRDALLGGGVLALGYARVESALEPLCDFLLDPGLQPAAYDFRSYSNVPYWTLNALRHYPAVMVDRALRRALLRAEQDGRLAALHPEYLFGLVKRCRQWRKPGRALYEVRLALCEVLERLPWEGEILREKMLSLAGLRRYRQAAQAARASAARQRLLLYDRRDGFRTPEFMEVRGLLYDALASGKVESFRAARPRIGDDPFLLYLSAWSLLFTIKDLARAGEAAAAAVRASAGLDHNFRDILAAVRIEQKRPREALRLLDEFEVLPVKRKAQSGWHLYFRARAKVQLGDERGARQDLESALDKDRRLLRSARAEPAFAGFTDLFGQIEEDYLDSIFAWNAG